MFLSRASSGLSRPPRHQRKWGHTHIFFCICCGRFITQKRRCQTWYLSRGYLFWQLRCVVSDVASFLAFSRRLTASRKFDCLCSSFRVLWMKSTTRGNVVIVVRFAPNQPQTVICWKTGRHGHRHSHQTIVAPESKGKPDRFLEKHLFLST